MSAGNVSKRTRAKLKLITERDRHEAAGVVQWVAAQGPGPGRETELTSLKPPPACDQCRRRRPRREDPTFRGTATCEMSHNRTPPLEIFGLRARKGLVRTHFRVTTTLGNSGEKRRQSRRDGVARRWAARAGAQRWCAAARAGSRRRRSVGRRWSPLTRCGRVGRVRWAGVIAVATTAGERSAGGQEVGRAAGLR